MPIQAFDLTGKRFGKLVAVEQRMMERNGKVRSYHRCRCDCGKERWVLTQNFVKGHTRSCGDPTTCAMYGPKPKPDSLMKQTYYTAKRGASTRSIPFSITLDDWKSITTTPCFYCGEPPSVRNVRLSRVTGRPRLNTPHNGLDRMDNSKGYELGNVVSCCWPCNRAKATLSMQEFLELVRKIAGRHP